MSVSVVHSRIVHSCGKYEATVVMSVKFYNIVLIKNRCWIVDIDCTSIWIRKGEKRYIKLFTYQTDKKISKCENTCWPTCKNRPFYSSAGSNVSWWNLNRKQFGSSYYNYKCIHLWGLCVKLHVYRVVNYSTTPTTKRQSKQPKGPIIENWFK